MIRCLVGLYCATVLVHACRADAGLFESFSDFGANSGFQLCRSLCGTEDTRMAFMMQNSDSTQWGV